MTIEPAAAASQAPYRPAIEIPAPPLLSAVTGLGLRAKASDVHLAPGEPPWLRRGGAFGPTREHPPLTPDATRSILDWVGGSDLSTARTVDGVRWRISTLAAVDGAHIKLRIIPDLPPPFEKLGLSEEVRALSQRTSGLVIAAGATGSGKTTTLASLIALIVTTRQVHLHTIEQPVEYLFEPLTALVSHRELGADLDADTALKTALRSDPDVVLFGEMRDNHDIDMCMKIAMSGHLVLTTMHAINAGAACERLVAGRGEEARSVLSQVLRAIVTQKLVPNRHDLTLRHVAAEVMLMNQTYKQLIKPGGQIDRIEGRLFQDRRSMDVSLANLVHAGKVDETLAANEAINDEHFALAMRRQRPQPGANAA